MSSLRTIFIYYVIIINVVAYAMMWYDKRMAIKKQHRVSEKQLFVLALCLGALGIYAGMKAPIYHKAAKPLFKFGIPLLIILNGVVVCLVFRRF